jgi:hypothetical protein
MSANDERDQGEAAFLEHTDDDNDALVGRPSRDGHLVIGNKHSRRWRAALIVATLLFAGLVYALSPLIRRTPASATSRLETKEKGHRHVNTLEMTLWRKSQRREVPDTSTLDWDRSAVVMNEIMANPSSGSEWVEIFNRGTHTVDAAGWKVADKAGNAGTWVGTSLPPGGHVVVEFTRKLNNGDEMIFLTDPSSYIVDTVEYGASERGKSFARIPDGCNWNMDLQSAPTKGFANPTFVVLNEVMANPLSGLEWVELYNPSNCDVDITGWSLKDKLDHPSQAFTSNVLQAKSHLVVYFAGRQLRIRQVRSRSHLDSRA